MTTIKTYFNRGEANHDIPILEANGVQCYLADEDSTIFSDGIGVRLRVEDGDVRRAAEVLKEQQMIHPLPTISKSKVGLLVFTLLLFTLTIPWLVASFGVSMLIILQVGLIVAGGFFVIYLRRCPHCGLRMKYHNEYIGIHYRPLYDCRGCGRVWSGPWRDAGSGG